MTEVDISPAKDGSVLKRIIKEGIGDSTPPPGSEVTVHYTATYLDGRKFDSSRDRNEPFTFSLKKGMVIKAWDIGVATMKKGEVAVLTCAAKSGHGKAGSPPKNRQDATQKFEIELLGWKCEDLSPSKDGSIEKYQITPGTQNLQPEEGALVNVHLVGTFNGKIFEERDVQFSLGETDEVVEGVDIALKSFKIGEKSRLIIKSKFAFKDKGKPELDIPPNATVEYEVELKSFEKAVEMWKLKGPEKIEQAKILKEKGLAYFKANKYNLALTMFLKGSTFMEYNHDFEDPDLNKERISLALPAHLNTALCYLKLEKYLEAKDYCTRALELDPQNEKALFRRGQAHLALASPELALKDFQRVLEIEPKNTAAAKQVTICNNLIKTQLVKEKKLYANMFDKFAKHDKQKEEEKLRGLPDVMRGTLGEWGQEERPGGRDATAFEKENPNILMLNANGTGEFQNM